MLLGRWKGYRGSGNVPSGFPLSPAFPPMGRVPCACGVCDLMAGLLLNFQLSPSKFRANGPLQRGPGSLGFRMTRGSFCGFKCAVD